MRHVLCVCLAALAVAWSGVQAAPAPAPKDASPAFIDAGCEKNIKGVLEDVVNWARIGVREDAKVAGLDIVRRQKDWEAWLKKNLRVERVEGTNHVRVSFRDGNREEQAAIINAAVDAYLKTVEQDRVSGTIVLKSMRDRLEVARQRDRLTPERLKKAETVQKMREERLRTLPSLVEHAKAR